MPPAAFFTFCARQRHANCIGRCVVWKTTQGFLWIIALLCLGYCAEITVKAKWSQSQGARDLEHSTISTAPSRGEVVGRIEIPRLNLSTVVFEGDDDDQLE